MADEKAQDYISNAETGDIYRRGVIYGYDDNMLIEALEAGGYEIPEDERWIELREDIGDALFDASQALLDAVSSRLEGLAAEGRLARSPDE